MSSTGITPLGPLYGTGPSYSSNLLPTPNTEEGCTNINTNATFSGDVTDHITHPISVPRESLPTPHPYTSYSYFSPHQAPGSLPGVDLSTSPSVLQQQPGSAPIPAYPEGPPHPVSAPAPCGDVLGEVKPLKAIQPNAAAEAAQLRAQMRVLEREIQELRQGLAQNASIGHRHAQIVAFASGVNGVGAPAVRRSKSVPKSKPEIAFNRRVGSPSREVRRRPTVPSKAHANGKGGQPLYAKEEGRNIDRQQGPSPHPTPVATSAIVKPTERAVVGVPLFTNSREIPLQGSAQGGALLPNSSDVGISSSGSCRVLDKTQHPVSHDASPASRFPLPETSSRDYCWLSADSRALRLPYTQTTKAPLTTTGSPSSNPIPTSTTAIPSSAGTALYAKSSTADPQNEIPSSVVGETQGVRELPSHPTSVASAGGGPLGVPSSSSPPAVLGADARNTGLVEVAAASSTASTPSSSAHQAALQYMARELAESRQQTTALRRGAEEGEALRSQLQLRLEALTAEVERLQSELKMAQDEIRILQERSHPDTASTTNATRDLSVLKEVQVPAAADAAQLTVASSVSQQQQQQSNSIESSTTPVHLTSSEGMSEVQIQLMQAREQIHTLSKKIAAWESWFAKQHPKSHKAVREKRSTSGKKIPLEVLSNTGRAKTRIRRVPPDDALTNSFPIGLPWPAGGVEGGPVPYGSVYTTHDEPPPQAFSNGKGTHHHRSKGEAAYDAHSNMIYTDAFAHLHAHQATPSYPVVEDAYRGCESLFPVGGFFPDVERGVMELIAKERAVRELSSEGRRMAEARLRAVLLAERRQKHGSGLNRDHESERAAVGSVSGSDGLDSEYRSGAPIEVQLSMSND
ncbi:unnamed protein product [Phytomonas sp. EM1]|nr:unnamed protein product [Phytomonas sp. EM1]|eukprot:CCW64708.1 unnamed protein product [Phytomonas sp. isolate EM1]